MARKRHDTILTVVRCGDTPWTADGRFQGRTDLPLSPDGRAGVQAAVERLVGRERLAAIHHPLDEAASDTAQIVASAVGGKLRPAEDLADPHLGLLEGLPALGVAERYPKRYKQWQDDPLALIPPEGEPLAEAQAHIFHVVSRILRKSKADEIGIVLHPIGFALLRCWFTRLPAGTLHSVLTEAPRLERYVVAAATTDELREAAESAGELAGSG